MTHLDKAGFEVGNGEGLLPAAFVRRVHAAGRACGLKGRALPPALVAAAPLGCGPACSWKRHQMAHEHYNRSNFLNIFNFHRTETDPGARQQNLGRMSTPHSKTLMI